jgi:hypothetical protein
MIAEGAQAFLATKTSPFSSFVIVIDTDEPQRDAYMAVAQELGVRIWENPDIGSMNAALNWSALLAAEEADIVGFLGDDHRFRTPGWDHTIEMVLFEHGGGIAYADDLAQRARLPTQVFISAPIIKALGWMGLPGAKHLYLDDTWRVLGERADCLYYLEDLVIEHMHPMYGKAEWDANHLRVNTQEMYNHDLNVFQAWVATTMESDIQRVRDALKSPVA